MKNYNIVSINKALSKINGMYQKWFQKAYHEQLSGSDIKCAVYGTGTVTEGNR